MRSIIITYQKTTEVTDNNATEDIISIFEDRTNKTVTVTVEYKDNTGIVVKRDNYNITNDNYVLLMSANPSFAPSKPANEYRTDDLWYIIDLIRSKATTS